MTHPRDTLEPALPGHWYRPLEEGRAQRGGGEQSAQALPMMLAVAISSSSKASDTLPDTA